MKTLELEQMEKVNGGVPLEEYCATLRMLMDNPENTLPESSQFFYDGFGCSYFE